MRQNGATMPSGVKASLQQEVQPTSKIISKETLYICNFFHTIFNLISPFLSSSMLVSSSAGSSRMNHRNLFMFKVSFHVWIVITILTFLFLAETSLCVDPHFEACKRLQNCGTGPNISYPFWIHEQQEPFCGYPGFEISCKSGTPIIHNPLLNISDDDHVIHQIFYQNQSLRIANAEALDNTCLPPIHKVTLQGTPFNFGPAHANLLLYLNCTPIHLNESVTNRISCASDNETLRSLALFGDDPLLNYVNDTKICKASAVAPVDKYGNATFETRGYRDYIEFLRRGFLLTWKAPICNVCEESGGRCGFNTTTYNFACFCPDRPHLKRCNAMTTLPRKIIIGVSTGGTFIILATIIVCWLKIRSSSGNSVAFWKKKTKSAQNVEQFLRDFGPLAPKRYKYSDVKKMTDSFKNKLGQGGFGGVFKGKLLNGGLVAVKVLSESKGNGEEFINEVASISRTSHVNIVTLLGFCVEGPKRALIYKFMPNGSLEKLIYNEKTVKTYPQLGWERLYQIAVGIARGLEYLHRGCNTRILHFDIKPHNILLDEDFYPKIADFGLAKLCPRKESIISMAGARGTPGYIAPEVFSRNFGGVSHKSDVYSYGMMVLEMVGGRKNIEVGVDNVSEIYFPHWIYNHLHQHRNLGLDRISTDWDEEISRKMIIVGLWCIQTNPYDRPSMSKVLEMLEGDLQSLPFPPKPFMSSPSRSPVDSPTK